jgi:DNA-binding transcriptional regulator YhcF (GntR family)
MPEPDVSIEAEKITVALTSARAAYEKLRQRASVLKVAKDQGWSVARELAILQDQEEDPLIKKAMKNAAKR